MGLFHRLRGWLNRLYAHPFNRERPVTALVRLVRWHTLRLSGRARDLEFWGTRTIRCYPDADGSMWLILNVVMDWNEFHFMRRYLRANDTFLDVGANLGIYTLWASQFVDTLSGHGRIVAVEPDPKNLSRLHEQLALNGLDRVKIAPVALSASAGTIRFSQGNDGLNHIILAEPTSEGYIKVPAITLDSYCAENNIALVSFLKIDVEGAEQLVLAGGRQMLAERRIDVIQLEFNEQVYNRGLSDSAVMALLEGYGYSLYRFDAAASTLTIVPRIDLLSHENLFAIHDVSQVRRRLAEGAS
ncbi:MAG TPA: FkbM family methyltransferase [Stellaceae bacterium]|nr:FkbM family methyltransferase [Stellaceae bacterium]